jgi:hypothetical protein
MDKIHDRPELMEDLHFTTGEEQVQLIMRNFPEIDERELRKLDLSQANWGPSPEDEVRDDDNRFTPIDIAVLSSMNISDKI